MVNLLFGLLLIFSVICVGTDINMDMFDILFFRTGIIALFISSLFDKPKREVPEYLNRAVALLLGLLIWNIFAHNFAPMVMHTTMNLFLAVVGFILLYRYYDTSKPLTKYILWGAGLNLIFFISQKIGFNPVYDIMPYKGEEGSFIGNQPRLMTYFSLITPFLWWPFLAISIGLGIFTKQVVIFAPVTIYLFAKLKTLREKVLFSILIILAGVYLWPKISYSFYYRFTESWKPLLTAFFKGPLIGFGLGVNPIEMREGSYSSYLQFMLGLGIPGLIWYGYVFKNIYKNIKPIPIALLSLAIVMLIEYPAELPRLWYLIIAILVVSLIPNKIKEV